MILATMILMLSRFGTFGTGKFLRRTHLNDALIESYCAAKGTLETCQEAIEIAGDSVKRLLTDCQDRH